MTYMKSRDFIVLKRQYVMLWGNDCKGKSRMRIKIVKLIEYKADDTYRHHINSVIQRDAGEDIDTKCNEAVFKVPD